MAGAINRAPTGVLARICGRHKWRPYRDACRGSIYRTRLFARLLLLTGVGFWDKVYLEVRYE